MSQKTYATFENYGNPALQKESEVITTSNYTPIEIQSIQHKKKILTDYGMVVVLVHAKWCGPCKGFKPKFFQYAKANINKAYFAQEDVDLGLTEGISAVPSILVYKRGKLFKIIKGGKLEEVDELLPPM